jgi:lysyl-tRNA synthetase class 2
MFRVLKNDEFKKANQTEDWQPTATLAALKARAEILQKIRDFFAARQVLEVETPLLSSAATVDLHIHNFVSNYEQFGNPTQQTLYLQSSPEFAMKRLLAAGSGSIYQLCKAFRNGDHGRQHNPEFTILEWYRLDFSHHDLMNEVDDFFQIILHTQPAQRYSYAEIFQQYLKIDPHQASINDLQNCASQHQLHTSLSNTDKHDDWLNLLLTHLIEPHLGLEQPTFIYDFPSSQAALARIRPGNPDVAERFEVYIKGMELANGYYELTDPVEQQHRFQQYRAYCERLDLQPPPVDQRLLDALTHGLPPCAGVALGVDRLIMLAMETAQIEDVIAFPLERA